MSTKTFKDTVRSKG